MRQPCNEICIRIRIVIGTYKSPLFLLLEYLLKKYPYSCINIQY